MDTAETYIKMCEKAEEIQRWADTARFENSTFIQSVYVDKDSHRPNQWYKYKHLMNVWLPRQDQLQEMLGWGNQIYQLLKDFTDWRYNHDYRKGVDETTFTSMEQLWLAFVMKEKYNKTWNGEDWIVKEG